MYRSWMSRIGAAAVAVGWAVAAGAADGTATVATATVTLTVQADAALQMNESLRREARAAIDRALTWLVAQQQADGHWSNGEFPALTGLPLWALARGGRADSEAAKKAAAYIAGCVHENGAIYREPKEKVKGGGLSNYNTAICMVALHLAGDPKFVPVVQKAREFVARSQHLGGDVYHGGMGYDESTGRPYADLSNSYLAYEAMRLTESVEDARTTAGGKKADLDWKAAQKFVQNTHNDARFNEQAWASDDPSEQGGFAYHPGQTRAGTTTNAAGIVKFRSMKGMTYAGLLSYIYANVDRTDPRVEATVNWAVAHWSLKSNNRVSGGTASYDTKGEQEGIYYLYNVMSKGLAAYGQDVFRPRDQAPFNWRVDLTQELLRRQKTDAATGQGYWVNEDGRYWESDPVLVTAYALIALQVAAGN